MTLSSSTVFIENLRLYAYHGVMPQERQVGAYFLLTVSVQCDVAKAIETDEVGDTLSYADLLEVLKTEMAKPSKLLEHVAGRIGKAVFSRFPQVEAVSVRLVKENPPMGANCSGAGVELHLTNDGLYNE